MRGPDTIVIEIDGEEIVLTVEQYFTITRAEKDEAILLINKET